MSPNTRVFGVQNGDKQARNRTFSVGERGHIFNYIIIRGGGGDGAGAALGGLAFDGAGARMGVDDELGEAGAPGGQTLF